MRFMLTTGTKNRIAKIIFHPALLSLVATILIIILFIPQIKKYRIRVIGVENLLKEKALFYDDLDGNGYSDKIYISDYASYNDMISLFVQYNPNSYFHEFDFRGSCPFIPPYFICTGDYDHNGQKEIYFMMVRNDSVFLNIIFNPISENSRKRTRFITTIKLWNGKPNVGVSSLVLADMDRDKLDELVFTVNSGFSYRPRKTFIYHIGKDSLISSPSIGFMLSGLKIADINGDGYPEIVNSGYATQNVDDTSKIPFHDKVCWLIVYDHKLNYLFPPKEFPDTGYSGLYSVPLQGRKDHAGLLSCYFPPESSKKTPVVYLISATGTILKSKSLPDASYSSSGQLFNVKTNKGKNYYFVPSASHYLILDSSLNIISHSKAALNRMRDPYYLDLDADGKNEMVFIYHGRRSIAITRDDLSEPVLLEMPDEDFSFTQLSVFKTPGNRPELAIFNGNHEIRLSYSLNPYYYIQWGTFLAIFLSIYLFSLLIRKIYLAQILHSQEAEKKISELQMAIVRNQMDPHFTMNIINSIMDSADRQDKKQVTSVLALFSKMYKSLLLSADKITRPLKEELEFTENYLALEKFRFGDRFNYSISIAPEVNPDWSVPKMILQMPVENAVKHGVSPLPAGGKVEIILSVEKKCLLMVVSDNGIGRKGSRSKSSGSTGKGESIVNQFTDLYYKISGKKITGEVIDLYNSDGSPAGTKVIVRIPVD